MKFSMADLDACRTVEEYATLLGSVKDRMKDLNAEFDPRPFSDEARTEWATLDEMVVELDARITEAKARRDRVEQLMSDPAPKQGIASGPFTGRTIAAAPRRVPEDIFAVEQYRNLSGSEDQLLQAYRDGAMFAVERAIYPNPQSIASIEQAHVQRLLDHNDAPSPQNPNRELARRILATGSPAYLRAFTKYLQGRGLNPDEQRAVAPWTVQTDATGGYSVPFYFDPTILHTGAWTNVNAYRQACTIKTIVGTDTYNAPTAGAFTVARAAEAAAAEEGLPAVGQISAIVAKVHGMGRMSMELLQDRPDVVSEIASLIAEAKDTEESSSFTVGVGDALGGGFNPIGMLPAHTTSGAYTHIDTGAANGAVAATDAYLIETNVPLRHRRNAAWFMGRDVIRVFQALETTGGQLFGGQQYASVGYPQQSPVGNTGLALLRYPIWETPDAPAFVAATDDLVIACLCDPKSFYIIERAGMSVETIPHIFDGEGKPTGQRGIYAYWRNTAKPADANAGRRLALKA
jgi:HK97 family phage major capsid protein